MTQFEPFETDFRDYPDVMIDKLQAEILRLKEQLQPYLDIDEANRKQEELTNRIEWLVGICIPSYNGRCAEKDRPIMHPDFTGWWNGASVTSFEVNDHTGNITVQVKSYVGCSEYEDKELILPKAWITAEDPKAMIQQWCVEEAARQLATRKEYMRKETLRKIESLTKQLQE